MYPLNYLLIKLIGEKELVNCNVLPVQSLPKSDILSENDICYHAWKADKVEQKTEQWFLLWAIANNLYSTLEL